MAITMRYGVIFTSLLPSRAFVVEVCSLEEVTCWAKKGHLGSDSDPTEPGVTNLIVAFGTSPWPYTLSLARVHVALNQKMCSIIEAMESAKEFKAAYYY